MPKKLQGTAVYSIRLENKGTTKIITLRVGQRFTEVSLEKDGELVELMREENGEITHEKPR